MADLFAAYVLYAKSRGLSAEILETGIGKIVARIFGPGASQAFDGESGTHCVQRVPPTESRGRRQTSYLRVAVLPMRPEVVYKPLPRAELDESFMIGTGPGGQHRQKTASCVRLKHLPTGLQVVIDGRDQHTNRKMALRVLTARVREAEAEAVNGDYGAIRRSAMGSGSRGEKVRTYNFIESRCVDHRTGRKTGNLKAIMRGEFGLVR